MSIVESTFEATVADVKNGKTKLVIKFDAEEIEREELANLNDMIGTNVEVTVKARAIIVKDEDKGKEYTLNSRGEVEVPAGQTNIDDYLEGDESEEEPLEEVMDEELQEEEHQIDEEQEEPSTEADDDLYSAI
ncbi:hypothetical protein [Ammoniphilus sp. YIM 78166]|uniref:hypothetical protein n=1 Tax=Ammoniphilus sp. YIM 78166 TaxID=1644106 RepID=UPI00106FCE3A|nr:hypothetical protein [Ammoniphilus sp. YIM 78166]